jgi:hypothetical protein
MASRFTSGRATATAPEVRRDPGRVRQPIAQADADTLLIWSKRFFTPERIEYVVR